ncbi:triple tyrosine motif-containing protein [Sediminitomix flava]|nr:triple tyrosine motif-containing protein [Sediminitomix flava]
MNFSLSLRIIPFLLITILVTKANSVIPIVKSYDKQVYQAGNQNWDIDIDDDGVVYIGNSKGLLCNILGEWNLSQLPDKGFISAVLSDDDVIWTGGKQIGYFDKSSDSLTYHFLKDLEGWMVWNIEQLGDYVYFQTEAKFYKIHRSTKEIIEINPSKRIWSFTIWDEQVWLMFNNGEIGYLEDDKFKRVSFFPEIEGKEVRKLLVHNDKLILFLLHGEIIQYDREKLMTLPLPEELKGKAFFTACSYGEELLCIGTITNGIAVIDTKGNLIKSANASTGLIDNTVLAVKVDKQGDIWMGLDYGLAEMEHQSALQDVFKGAGVYDAVDFEGKTYLATNKGLYESNREGGFSLFGSTGGQVWGLKVINDELFISHNRGLMTLKNGAMTYPQNIIGFIDVSKFGNSPYYVVSTYEGVLLMKREDNRFYPLENLHIQELPKLTYDHKNDCIWTEARDKVVHKLLLKQDNSVEKTRFDNLKRVFPTKKGLYFSDGKNILQYQKEHFFVSENRLIEQVNGTNFKFLDISLDGNALSYISEQEIGLLVRLPDGNVHSYSSLLGSLSDGLLNGYEFLSLEENTLRIATDRGLVILDYNFRSEFRTATDPVISSITVLGDQPQKVFYPFNTKGVSLPSGPKDFLIRGIVNSSKYDAIEYRWRLFPLEQDWSEWGKSADKIIYSHIPGGDYEFQLQSRSNGGEVQEEQIAISIDLLWYQTWVGVIVVIVSVFTLLFAFYYITHYLNKRKLAVQKDYFQKQQTKKTLEMKNDQLLQYVEIIGHKNSILNQIKEALEKMRNKEAQRWINLIESEVKNEKKEFLFHKLFSEIHQDFISRISEEYPILTSNDIRILSFIRINLDKYEIANLMHISPRSLDTSRYRIRKKMDLDPQEDLSQFIRNF